jgi:chromosomal replication initiation ATPase DnaA
MDEELIKLIKNQVIEEIKREYFLIKKTEQFDLNDKTKMDTLVLHVTDIVCDYFKIEKPKIFEKNRKRTYTEIRYIIYIICREGLKFPIPLAQIGKFFGKDHSSVYAGYNTGLDLMQFNKQFKDNVIEAKKLVTLSLMKKEN